MPANALPNARSFARGLLSALVCLAACTAAAADSAYPTRPVRFIVPFAPGGSTDTLARTLAQKLSDALGQQVVVDNRSGGNGNIGTELVARATPDGHTIVLGYIANLGIGPSLYAKLPYDPVKDFAPVTLLAVAPNILVAHPSVPVKNVRELVAYAKANPNKVNYASAAVASLGHLAGELLNSSAGIHMQHVPYKGLAAASADLIGGRIELLFDQISAASQNARAGNVKALAVTTSTRSSLMPELPTMHEAGVTGYEAVTWFGMLGPANMPKDLANKISADLSRAMTRAEHRDRLASQHFDLSFGRPEEFDAFLKSETAKWGKAIREAGIQAD